MILRNIFLFFFTYLLASYTSGLSQNIISVTGSVSSTKGDRLQYANLYVSENGIGVISNEEGEFNLNLPRANKNHLLKISYIGFKSKEILLSGENEVLNIILEEDISILDEVVIKSFDARTAVEKAIEKKSENYLNRPIYLMAFNREEFYQGDALLYVGEAQTATYSVPYFDFKKDNQIKVLRGQFLFLGNDSIENERNTKIINGINGTIYLDIIKMNPEFIKLNKTKGYEYNFLDNMNYDGNECYQIEFYSPVQKYKGSIIIDQTNFAIIAAKIELTDLGLKDMSSRKGVVITSFKIESSYLQLRNGKWCFSNGKVIVEFNSKESIKPIKVIIETVVTQQNFDNVNPFRANEIVRNYTFKQAVNDKYDNTFWKDQNILKEPSRYLRKKG